MLFTFTAKLQNSQKILTSSQVSDDNFDTIYFLHDRCKNLHYMQDVILHMFHQYEFPDGNKEIISKQKRKKSSQVIIQINKMEDGRHTLALTSNTKTSSQTTSTCLPVSLLGFTHRVRALWNCSCFESVAAFTGTIRRAAIYPLPPIP